MKDNTLWEDALDHVEPNLVSAAARPRKKRHAIRWIGAAAAILALVIFLQAMSIPMFMQARAVATASEPRITPRPNINSSDYDTWVEKRVTRADLSNAALTKMDLFLKSSCNQFLSGTDENILYSPINVYIGLAMLAECTAGNSRQQLLDLLGTQDMDTLRRSISALWETAYNDEQSQTVVLANSLWLDKELPIVQSTADTLGWYYYAMVLQSDLSTASEAFARWVKSNSGGMLKDVTDAYQFPPEAVLALCSTVFFQGRWSSEFDSANNTAGKFHAPGGDMTCTFMNARLREMNYYWGEDFGAVCLGMKNGSTMWFFLPDEGKTVDDILASEEYMDVLLHRQSVQGNSKYLKVNLSIPKFDVSSTADLAGGLMDLGITDVFRQGIADFSGITDAEVFLTAAKQSVRVCIDEKGVKAAAYFELPGAGSAMPPDEIIDFILDRPFLFVITADTIPLFAGVVNQP